MNFIRKPFPMMPGLRTRILSAVGFGAFVWLFLWLYAPFGLGNTGAALPWVSLGYGAITTAVMLALQVGALPLFPKWYNEDTWTIGREMAHTMANISLIAALNLIYSVWLGFFVLKFTDFLIFMGFTLGVGIFPVTLQILVRQYVMQQRNVEKGIDITKRLPDSQPSIQVFAERQSQTICLLDDDNNAILTLIPEKIVALEAADNYTKVYYEENGALKHTLIRGALSRFENLLAAHSDAYMRVHRSWVVNLNCVLKVEGNARGYLLNIAHLKHQIPVARRRLSDFDKAMK